LLKAKAFAPCHVTGFFEIHDEALDVRRRGSKGAGICLSRGVTTTVEVMDSEEQVVEIFLNDCKDDAPVTSLVVKKIVGDRPYLIRINSRLDLPQKQGFGISGAGALSTGFALNKALDLELSREELACIAHEAEIQCGTGLGDVYPQLVGGVVIREKEGCPEFGLLNKINFDVNPKIVVCVIGEEVSTKDIITDPEHKKRINENGEKCLKILLENPSFKEFFKLSKTFSVNTDLLSSDVKEALDAVKEHGTASMSMLGNSIFSYGETEKIVDILEEFGDVCICNIDNKGARIVEESDGRASD
jgi:pantoate kinase